MKKILLIVMLFLAMGANAQQLKKSNNSANPKNENPTPEQVAELNQRINALINDIESLYSQYKGMSDQWFQNKKEIDKKFNGENGVKKEQQAQLVMINEANGKITTIKGELKWIDELRNYYEKGSLDDLYRGNSDHPCADVATLMLHKQLLGSNYPKKIDDLLLLAESAQSLKEEYDAARNKDYRNRLRNMAECDIKWDIDGLLAVHGDIKKEMDNWEEHTLKGLMDKKSYLMNEYGVDLDKDFPYLAEQAWKSIKKTNN